MATGSDDGKYVNKGFVADERRNVRAFGARSDIYVVNGDGLNDPDGSRALSLSGREPKRLPHLDNAGAYPDVRAHPADYRDDVTVDLSQSKARSETPRGENQTKSSTQTRQCPVIAIIAPVFLILAGIALVLTLYFLGYFTPVPSWKDGYDVTALFSNTYNSAFEEKTSLEYQSEVDLFKKLTEAILNNSIHTGGYHIEINNILPGSTKYLFIIELKKKTDADNLQILLENGYTDAFKNGETALDLIIVIVKKNDEYTTSTVPMTTKTETTQVGELTTLSIVDPIRTTPVPVAACKPLEEARCLQFGYNTIGSKNTANFADLQKLVSKQCYGAALEFACVSSFPPCENNRERFPCREFCEKFRTNCSFPLPCDAYLDDDSDDLCYTSPDAKREEDVERNPQPELCSNDEFQCGTGSCKPSNVECNEIDDCGDYSDELLCPGQKGIGLDCDFSKGDICSYTIDNKGDFSWMLNKGETPSLNTGPLTDHTTRNNTGLYLYAEASGQYPFSVARIMSVEIATHDDWCLRFYYHMFGDQIESLKVYQYFVNNAVNKERLLWQRSHNQGDRWIYSGVTLPAGRYQIVFEATRGTGYRGDIAIDDISARKGPCPYSVNGCKENQFHCRNGNCIDTSYVCNSLNECGDYSDERGCNCTTMEFQCHFGMCIPLYQRCDNKRQCPDGSDESGCDALCSDGRHKCNDGSCILPEWLCDHEADCPDNSDEINCAHCRSDEWQCRDRQCVASDKICDTKRDCSDGSDEWNCFKVSENGLVSVRKDSTNNWMPICSSGFKASYYDEICKQVGHSKATGHNVKKVNVAQFAVLSEALNRSSLLEQLTQRPSCENNEVITVTCSVIDCGQPSKDSHPVSYIVNGQDAHIGQWPWQIALYVYHQSQWRFSCGGSLVNHNHVITAAHCVKLYSDPAKYKVILGSNLLNVADDANKLEVDVSDIVKHAEFTDVEWGNDIAVLALAKSVTFNDRIRPICLPNSDEEFSVNSQCYVSGWGKTDFYNSSSIPVNLQETKMKLWSSEQCSVAYVNYNDKMICAGYQSGYTGNCQGDSGGPLQCRDQHGLWKLYGIFSYFVIGCNVPMQPPVFTRVEKYLGWLNDKLECKFTCNNGRCLMDDSVRCNGINNCGDLSDEVGCNTSLTCDFEDQYICGYTHSSTLPGSNSWSRVSSGFSVRNAPVTDHTKGDGSGYYMYAGLHDSYLLSPITTLNTSGCLEFSLHGRIQANLDFAVVHITDDINHPSEVDISKISYRTINLPFLDLWQRVRQDLPSDRFIVVFRSVTGFTSIDDVLLLEGSCASQKPDCAAGEVFCDNNCVKASQVCNYHTQCFALQDEQSCTNKQGAYRCDLENYRDCFLEQGNFDSEDWTWYRPSNSQLNGPLNDHTTQGNGGHVLFLNTKLINPGRHAVISLPVKIPFVSCLEFYYNMNSTGTLLVRACAGAVCTILFHKQDVATAGWQQVQLEVETAVSSIEIYGYAGHETDKVKNYISIDDIGINPGLCTALTCRPDQFQCENGDCIMKSLICDNYFDCDDDSDEDDKLCKNITKMTPDMFRCDDGTYRQPYLRCDQIPDCPDQSDEIGCNETGCREDEFVCDNGKCKNRYSKNDGHQDCKDGSDETGKCEFYQFTCNNGQCIAGFRFCDGNIDCSDASDEPVTGCQCNNSYHFTCGDNKCIAKEYDCDGDGIAHCSDKLDEDPNRCIFTCSQSSPDIIQVSHVCDAIPDCPRGEDETLNCACPFGYSTCIYGGCVPEDKICDGFYDCLDHSDEAKCDCSGENSYKCKSGMCLPPTSKCNKIIECDDWSDELNCSLTESGCGQNYFACKNGVCVLNEVKCDGQDNCGDGSDEENCACDDKTEYHCQADNSCIPSSWKCDRISDCSDGDDEISCDVQCSGAQFQCDYLQYSCIPITQRCDGHYNCKDGSDEMLCERINQQGVIEGLRGSQWMVICSSGWFTNWNQDICHHLGRGEVTGFSEVIAKAEKYLIIKNGITNITNPVFTLDLMEDVERCPNEKGIVITCSEPVCGVPPPAPSALIIGGHKSTPNSWPWMAAILHAGKPLCGAVIIDSRWLITAAHCFKAQTLTDGKLKYTTQYIKVIIGSTKLTYPNTKIVKTDESRMELEVERVVIHPDFNINNNNILLNDIALVKLKNSISSSDTKIRYICHPTKYEELPEKANCYTAGWGFIDYRNGDEPNKLKRAIDLRDSRLNIWSSDKCENVWGNGINSTIHLCAGSTSTRPAVCQGDSGGPLMCKQKNSIWQLYGVTSFGQSDCGQTGDVIKPTIFTRVSTYNDWLNSYITGL